MRKRFIENLAFFLTLNLLIKPIYVFGIDRVVQNTVGTEVYGSYFPLFNLVIILQIFLDLGIENFTRKEIASSPGMANRLFSKFLILKLLLIVLFISILSIAGLFLPQSKGEWKILFILLINQSMANLILFLRANMGGLQLFKTESLVSVFDRLLMIMICGTLLFMPLTKNIFKIEWFVLSQTVAYAFTLLVSLIIIIKKSGIPKIQFNIASYLPVLKQLLPYATLVLLMAFYYRIDSVFLRYFLSDGKEQAGIYAHGFRILDFMSNYALIFSFILLPTFANMIRQKESVSSLLRLAFLTLTVPSLALLSGIVFYRYEVFDLLYVDHVSVSADIFTVFIISYTGVCFSYTFGALLTANGNLKELNLMALFAVLISVVLNLILIPKYKVAGAAIANAVAQTFTIVFHVVVTKKKFLLKTNSSLLLKFLSFIVFTALIGYLVSSTKINWFIGLLVIDIFSFAFAITIRLINLSKAKALLFSKTDE
ncbi:MAG: oligosaccharide flippase family protein [Bacteroidales bacterium]|nr:oligosaccharide flippase family protein [Bacteroidales bacterium]MBN2817578.1 oligosaccharide flippase family protein [Bacteroidales bacterium]